MKKNNYEEMSLGENLIASLNQAISFERGEKVPGTKKSIVTVAPVPHYKGNKIKKIRNKLGLSQSTFAHIIGVSVKTIEAWESGRNEPQGPAQRILYFLENDDKFLEKYQLVAIS